MPQDVRRSDQTEGPGPESAEKTGFARSLFRFGGKRKKAEPARLTDRLKEVLERDRALVASQPPQAASAQDEIELHDDDVWPDPFGASDPERHTGTRPTERSFAEHALDEPFAHAGPSEHSVLQLAEARESADLRLSQIASWIEEEITEQADGAGPLALDAPLNADEAAELDAVLSGSNELELEQVEQPAPVDEARGDETLIEPTVNLEAPGDQTLISSSAELQAAIAEQPKASAPSSRAQVKAKLSARPAAREEAASREPINTLTMARLLAMQGYKPRALAIYRELLKRNPEDAALRTEFEALELSEP
jgi:hypothetical protein